MTPIIIELVRVLGFVLYAAIIGRVIISWINVSPSNPIVGIIYKVTEPILGPIRRMLPAMGGLDLSPMIALILVTVFQRIIFFALRA